MNMKKFFRTYFPFASNQIKACMAYKGSVYLFILCSLFSSLINYYLWKAVYGSAGGGVIGGLTVSEMGYLCIYDICDKNGGQCIN